MAEIYFKELCKKAGRTDIEVASAGTFAGIGIPASPNAREAVQTDGMDLDGFKSSMLTTAQLNDADLIVTMTDGHRLQVLNIMPKLAGRVRLLMDFYKGKGSGSDVSDPFGGSLDEYSHCFKQMKKALDNLFKNIDEVIES
jgi:protein-tyrosine-phosphatase